MRTSSRKSTQKKSSTTSQSSGHKQKRAGTSNSGTGVRNLRRISPPASRRKTLLRKNRAFSPPAASRSKRAGAYTRSVTRQAWAHPFERALRAARPSLTLSQERARAWRKARARSLIAYLKKAYPKPKSELHYKTPFQFLVAVVLSAQCTDKAVNKLTATLFKKYKTPADFASAKPAVFEKELSSIPFFRNKAKAIIAAAENTMIYHSGRVPKTEKELIALPGVGYKTAHVILGELFDIWEGIATDTHVRRFALRFDLTDNTDSMKISKDLETLIPKKDWKYVNNGLVLYGRYVCPARKHDCTNHPLTKIYPPAANRWPKAKS